MIMSASFDRLVEIVKQLRSPQGCPWDREQNLYSIKEHFMEEAYELLDALDNKDEKNIREELGDVLFHVVFHSEMAESEAGFDINDVLEVINEKLVRRHPHVFGDETVNCTEDVLVKWDEIKAEEKKDERKSFFDGVPFSMPPIRRARKLQEKARKAGFDWEKPEDCLDKVREEFSEFEESLKSGVKDEIEHEMGDLIFAVVNMARFAGVCADEALRKCNERFITRFDYIGKRLAEKGLAYEDVTLTDMDKLWNEAKAFEKNNSD
jgi:tetrapyrrole methylase family protein/MazG family protein